MALRLEVISAQREQLGPRARIVLGVAGGSIGRSLDNDWVLPDMQRFLSGHHARIHCRDGLYYLEDNSSNGTYLNDAVAPLGRRAVQAQLHSGDTLRMGEYRIRVFIEEEEAAAEPASSAARKSGTSRNSPADPESTIVPILEKPVKKGGDDLIDLDALMAAARTPTAMTARPVSRPSEDLGESLDISSLILRTGARAAAELEAAAMGLEASGPVALDGTASIRIAGTGNQPASADAQQSARERLALLRAAAKARLDGVNPLKDVQNSLQAFCRGAGLEPGDLPVADELQAMHLVGRLLRESLLGLREILRAQQEFRERNGIECEAPEGRSPLDLPTDEYLLALLAGHEQRKLDAVMLLRDQFTHAGRHAAALDPAVRAALAEFMAHLEPTRLATGTSDEEMIADWKRYKEIYAALLQNTRNGAMPHLFLEALAQAYLAARSGKS
jgi:type VI secretion system protein